MSQPTARELLDDLDTTDRKAVKLAIRVERVLALHIPTPLYGSMEFCWCGDVWPCTTVRLLNGEDATS